MPCPSPVRALSDPRRRAIFESLRSGAKSVAVIGLERPVSRPAVSQHLKVLQTAGLVQVTVKEHGIFYHIRRNGLNALREYIESFWAETLDAFTPHVHDTIETEKEP